jgi:hypothetical protein
MFGSLYAISVAAFPEAIFALAAGILLVAFALICLVRSRKHIQEGTPAAVRPNRAHWLREESEAEAIRRGRSRRSKNLSFSEPPVTPP